MMQKHFAGSALRNTMMALPVLAGLSGQAMAHAPDTSLRPMPRPDNLTQTVEPQQEASSAILVSPRPEARPFTLGTSALFKQIYMAEESQNMQMRMDAHLGGTNHGVVLNWDGIDLGDHTDEELMVLQMELEQLSRLPGDRRSFTEIASARVHGEFYVPNFQREATQEHIESTYMWSHMQPYITNGDTHISIASYGDLNEGSLVAQMPSPAMPLTLEEEQALNAQMDDYVMRHERCHGFDPIVYGESIEADNLDLLDNSIVGSSGPIPLDRSYRVYHAEMFADACATLEYALEGNQEGLAFMENISYYRDAGALANMQAIASFSKNPPAQTQVISSESLLSHHTGPTIREIARWGTHLSETDRAILASDPEMFEDFIRHSISRSRLSPEEFRSIADDMTQLGRVDNHAIGEATTELIQDGIAGRKVVIEDNMQIPRGSIDALRELAPEATRGMARDIVQMYTPHNAHPVMQGINKVTPEDLSAFPVDQRLILATSYSYASNFDVWENTNTLSPDLITGPYTPSPEHTVPTNVNEFFANSVQQVSLETGPQLERVNEMMTQLEQHELESFSPSQEHEL